MSPDRLRGPAEDAYSEILLDHFRQPRNTGDLDRPSAVGVAENPVSGATIELQLFVDRDRIENAAFRSQGCAATIAASSVTTELLIGLTLTEAVSLSRHQIEEALGGLPPTRKHASALAEDAVRAALEDYRSRAGG